ncbi:hypothetical protein HDV64DRAFT_256325 [Trichoderma sp. TUCIM 5745]
MWRVVTTTASLVISFLSAQSRPSVPVALSLEKLAEGEQCYSIDHKVTTPPPTNIITMIPAVNENPVTAAPAPALAISSAGLSTSDHQTPKWHITETDAVSTIATIFAKRSTATISGQSGIYIGIVGALVCQF